MRRRLSRWTTNSAATATLTRISIGIPPAGTSLRLAFPTSKSISGPIVYCRPSGRRRRSERSQKRSIATLPTPTIAATCLSPTQSTLKFSVATSSVMGLTTASNGRGIDIRMRMPAIPSATHWAIRYPIVLELKRCRCRPLWPTSTMMARWMWPSRIPAWTISLSCTARAVVSWAHRCRACWWELRPAVSGRLTSMRMARPTTSLSPIRAATRFR